MTTVADLVADALDRHCAGPVFGVLGEGTLAITDRLVHRHGRRAVATAREDGAVSMADGYARVSGEVALAAVTHGPGLTNTVTALTEAARARTPMVLLAGDTPVAADGNPQKIDQAAVVAPTGASFWRVRTPSSAADDLVAALRHTVLERIPVVIDVPTDLLLEDVPAAADVSDLGLVDPMPIAPSFAAVEAVRVAVEDAHHVVVLAGRGAIESRDAVVALADHLGAHLATTLLAKGLFTGEVDDVGVCGGFATEMGHDVIRNADVVLALGASLNRFTRDDGRLLDDATVVHVDSDARSLRTHGVVAVHADVETFCRVIVDALPRSNRAESVGSVAAGGPTRRRSDDARGLDLHDVVATLDAALPEDRVVVVDGGHAALSEPSRSMCVTTAGSFVFPLHFGSIGLSLSTAVGAALAANGRPTVCFVGDGGLLMSLAELDTVARESIPLTIVVMNDQAYGWEYHQMAEAGIDTDLSTFDRPSFAAVSRALGVDAVRVATRAELERLTDRIGAADRPLLVEACLDREVRTEWYAAHAAPATAMGDLAATGLTSNHI